jgi:predicted PurR-regulated permease PerM
VRTFVTGKGLGQWLLLAAFATILYFCFRIMQPFLMPIFLALILSTLLSPVYTVVSKKLNNRRSLSAFIVCIGLTVAILVPVVFLSMSLVSEVNDAYQRLKNPETLRKIESWLDPTNSPIVRRIQTWLPASFHVESLQLGAQAQRLGIALLGVATAFAAGIVNFIVDYFIMVAALFFLLRDSDYFAERARAISPLSGEQESMFVERFRTVARATVLGNLATTLTQGTVSAFTFFFLGLPNPLLWGLLIALLSLIPVFGAALIWVPWTIYLFVRGSIGKAVVLLVMQIVVVGSADNILRPLFIRGGAKMHTLIVFFSILGAVAYFGITGILFGPLIFAIAIALLEFYVVVPSEHITEPSE